MMFKAFFIVILFFLVSNSYGQSSFQKTFINSDGSGTIKLTYWAKTADIKGKEMVNSFPFTEQKINSTYASSNNSVDSVSIGKTNPDTTYINVSIAFKSITQINSAPGFSKSKVTYYKTPDSTTMIYRLEKTDEAISPDTKTFYSFQLPTDNIMRTSGVKTKADLITYELKTENVKNGVNMYAVFKTVEKIETETTHKESPKSCGLFGFELPVIILLSFIGYISKKKP